MGSNLRTRILMHIHRTTHYEQRGEESKIANAQRLGLREAAAAEERAQDLGTYVQSVTHSA